jgi:hypothetical protein
MTQGISAAVDEQFNKVSFMLDDTPNSAYSVVLTKTANNKYTVSYEGYFNGTKSTKTLPPASLEALLAAMSKSPDFDKKCIAEVRAQAALMPSEVYADRAKNMGIVDGTTTVKQTLIAFFTQPSQETYNAILSIYAKYRILNIEDRGLPAFNRAARSSYTASISAVSSQLWDKVELDMESRVSRKLSSMASKTSGPAYKAFSTVYGIIGGDR